MAKKSVIWRNIKRVESVERYKKKREYLKRLIEKTYHEEGNSLVIRAKLKKLPLNSSPVRVRFRCELCHRGRSVQRRFNLCRMCLRKLAEKGYIPGLRKASW